MRKSREILDPKGRHRIEFVKHHPTWEYQAFDLIRKRWRKVPQPSSAFPSYAAALIHATNGNLWMAQALTPNEWTVEHFRGQVFHFAAFEDIHGYSGHCLCCRRSIAPAHLELPAAETRGLVTRYEIPDGSGRWQWNWACSDCFNALRAELDWQIGDGDAHRV